MKTDTIMNIENLKNKLKLISFRYEEECGIIKPPAVDLQEALDLIDALSILNLFGSTEENTERHDTEGCYGEVI